MADNTHRDSKTGRFARRPVPDVDAESKFDPMGDDIPFYDASGAASPSTTPRGRYAPSSDDLAQGGQGSPLRARYPELVHPDDEGCHNAVMRTAARLSQRPDDPTGYLVGLNWSGTPATGVRTVDDGR